jgi:hypothetical protein
MKSVTILSAESVVGHRLKISFSDGKVTEVDFKPFLERFDHPDYARYLNLDEFLKYRIVDGNINWGDYQMIFTIDSLYNGTI